MSTVTLARLGAADMRCTVTGDFVANDASATLIVGGVTFEDADTYVINIATADGATSLMDETSGTSASGTITATGLDLSGAAVQTELGRALHDRIDAVVVVTDTTLSTAVAFAPVKIIRAPEPV